jgi:hypothetical protein
MSNNKKTLVSYIKPSRAEIARSVATSTAIETGQSSAEIKASLEAKRKKYAHLHLGD